MFTPTLIYANTINIVPKNGTKDFMLSSKLGNDLNTHAPLTDVKNINAVNGINVLIDLKNPLVMSENKPHNRKKYSLL